mmetsp:Transcript_19074/g.39459  ORF Transcript_19074/g.39459 Transcript_19074/m.39459 type:complete len:255 (-) Transcript_19074:1537-2301(-)
MTLLRTLIKGGGSGGGAPTGGGALVAGEGMKGEGPTGVDFITSVGRGFSAALFIAPIDSSNDFKRSNNCDCCWLSMDELLPFFFSPIFCCLKVASIRFNRSPSSCAAFSSAALISDVSSDSSSTASEIVATFSSSACKRSFPTNSTFAGPEFCRFTFSFNSLVAVIAPITTVSNFGKVVSTCSSSFLTLSSKDSKSISCNFGKVSDITFFNISTRSIPSVLLSPTSSTELFSSMNWFWRCSSRARIWVCVAMSI